MVRVVPRIGDEQESRQRARAGISRLLEQARSLASDCRADAALLARLQQSSGLSAAGVLFALDHCVELTPTSQQWDALLGIAEPCRAAHIVLSSNVFVAAVRAIALGLAASPRVFVKPSRRDRAFAQVLHERCPGLFQLVEQIEPQAGDSVWAYGHDVTLRALAGELAPGVHLHAFGEGFGVALLRGQTSLVALDELAKDVVAFDQKGCLSPRLVLCDGTREQVDGLCEHLALALGRWGDAVPLGPLDWESQASMVWFKRVAACFGPQWSVGASGSVTRCFLRASGGELELAPFGRHLLVTEVEHFEPWLAALGASVTCVGASHVEDAALAARVLPQARSVALGQMQRPPLDGPADRRRGRLGLVG